MRRQVAPQSVAVAWRITGTLRVGAEVSWGGSARVGAEVEVLRAAGIIAGVLGVTGLGSKIATLIDLASGGYLLLALFFTMLTSIILGMGLPTTAAYLILATVVAPARSTCATARSTTGGGAAG